MFNLTSRPSSQQTRLLKELERLKLLPASEFELTDLKEQDSFVTIHTAVPFSELDLSTLFSYRIFPEKIMRSLSEWITEDRQMRIGDTIAQEVYFPQKRFFSVRMIFGVRIVEIIDSYGKRGFSYVTLVGHAEKGISTFTLEQMGNSILFRIHTFSSPGNFISRLLSPITNRFQHKCTQEALKKVKEQLEQTNNSTRTV